MERVYETVNSNGSLVGLYKRNHKEFPYCIKVAGNIIAYVDCLRSAYVHYNRVAI